MKKDLKDNSKINEDELKKIIDKKLSEQDTEIQKGTNKKIIRG